MMPMPMGGGGGDVTLLGIIAVLAFSFWLVERIIVIMELSMNEYRPHVPYRASEQEQKAIRRKARNTFLRDLFIPFWATIKYIYNAWKSNFG
jgi:hypothetical protein